MRRSPTPCQDRKNGHPPASPAYQSGRFPEGDDELMSPTDRVSSLTLAYENN